MSDYPPVLAVDFDGTIVENKFPGIGKLMPNSKEVLQRLYGMGCRIIIWTCRTGMRLEDAIDFCNAEGIPFDTVNENLPEIIQAFGGDMRKVFANYYIDDRNLWGLGSWLLIEKVILSDPYFKEE